MDVCDRLEAELATIRAESSRLLESVLHRALDGSDRVPESMRSRASDLLNAT